jgi:hypothetical protein
MRKNVEVSMVIWLLFGTASSLAQEPRVRPCLHSQPEAPAQRARRQLALKMAREINLAESVYRPKPNFRQQPSYRPLRELANISPVPAGFTVQLSTDGPTYTFSVKDSLDACEYAIFSDQDQGIYEATPTPTVGVVPLVTH